MLHLPSATRAKTRAASRLVFLRKLTTLPAAVVADYLSRVGVMEGRKPLTVQALSTAALVKRGDLVRLLIEKNGLRLSVSGEALDTGGSGERVRVVNESSKRELVGRVVDHGTVSVVY